MENKIISVYLSKENQLIIFIKNDTSKFNFYNVKIESKILSLLMNDDFIEINLKQHSLIAKNYHPFLLIGEINFLGEIIKEHELKINFN